MGQIPGFAPCPNFAPEAAPFVPLLCSNSRLPPALLRGPLRDSPALRRLVEELLRRYFLSVGRRLTGYDQGIESRDSLDAWQ